MVEVKARYKDKYTKGEWSYCQGTFSSIEAAYEWWGFGTDSTIEKWEILETKLINDN